MRFSVETNQQTLNMVNSLQIRLVARGSKEAMQPPDSKPSKSAESILMVRYTVIWKFLHGCLGKLGLKITLLNLPQAKPAPRPHGALDFVLWGLEWLGVRSRGSQQWKKTLAKTFFYKNSIKESRCSFLVSHATPWRLQLNLWRFETSSGALFGQISSKYDQNRTRFLLGAVRC